MNELISVIIPVYNTEKYLEKCINSVISQTYEHLEIILINDGSTDMSLEICKKYEKQDSRIVLLSQENKGVSSARNKGIINCNGNYIIFLDSDDFIEHNMIEYLYKNIKSTGGDISICNYYKVIDTDRKANNSKEIIGTLEKESFFKFMFEDDKFGGYLWNKLINKSIIKDIRFDENLSIMEDLIFLSEIAQNVRTVFYDSQACLYNYVLRPNSAMKHRKQNESMFQSFDRLISKLNGYKDLQNKCIFDYVYFATEYKYMIDRKKDKKVLYDKCKTIKRKYLLRALSTAYYGISKKIKLILIIIFPSIFFKIRDFCKND